jgi:hypothetical protein
MARCTVSFTDTNGIPNSVEVEAGSLYEAVARAVSEFRADPMTEAPGAMTEFSVAIHRPAVEHKIRLNQVEKWTEGTRDGPAGIVKRQRVRSLLNKHP